MSNDDPEALRARIAELEEQLKTAQDHLKQNSNHAQQNATSNGVVKHEPPSTTTPLISLPPQVEQPTNHANKTELSFGLSNQFDDLTNSLHNLLLLSDSALPLGSFAYSSGLESFLAHQKLSSSSSSSSSQVNSPPLVLFRRFLKLSLESLARTSLPYVLSAHREPSLENLLELDNDFDASTPCTVARRASVAQGRALVGVWERAFASYTQSQPQLTSKGTNGITEKNESSRSEKNETETRNGTDLHGQKAEEQNNGRHGLTNGTDVNLISTTNTTLPFTHKHDHNNNNPVPTSPHTNPSETLRQFSRELKLAAISNEILLPVCGHFPPLFGLTSLTLQIPLSQTAYLFLLSHAKAVISAAVRSSVMGPYQAQAELAGGELQALIRQCLEDNWTVLTQEAGQTVPVLDLWVGRHEVLYSRIFNS